eukprot:GEMP01063468.1.p1 GENE.GEMP01063468.1~~GEMP01063468.1.p1  ORF type:complete len:356 (+),score=48.25 GEMP01063468.1:51-1118(+)
MADVQPVEAEAPDFLKKCFRSANELFYGHVKRHPEKENAWIRHGMGKLLATKGTDEEGRVIISTYEGWFEEDKISGNGVYTFQDGSVYHGDLVDGIVHGNGRMTWPDESVYEGSWVNGEMQGQGRFVAEKGEFMEGEFQRNRFFYRGVWTDIIEDVIRYRETDALLASGQTQSPVIFCLPDETNLHETIEVVLQRDNLIPFIIADSETGNPTQFVGENVLHLGHAVACRRRHQDYKKLFSSGIERAFKEKSLFSIIFAEEEGKIPDTWTLDNFFDPFSFPLEIFNPKTFRGRPLLQTRFTTEENFGDLCRFAIVAFPLEIEVTPMKDAIREAVYQRYSRHIPLHRCAIIVLTSLT